MIFDLFRKKLPKINETNQKKVKRTSSTSLIRSKLKKRKTKKPQEMILQPIVEPQITISLIQWHNKSQYNTNIYKGAIRRFSYRLPNGFWKNLWFIYSLVCD